MEIKREIRYKLGPLNDIGSYPSKFAALMDCAVFDPILSMQFYAGELEADDVHHVRLLDAVRLMAADGHKWDFSLYQEGILKLHKKYATDDFLKTGSMENYIDFAETESSLLFCASQVILNGSNVFVASRGLVEKMILTKADLKFRDIRFPFDAFVIEIPSGIFQIRSKEGGKYTTTSITACLVSRAVSGEMIFSMRGVSNNSYSSGLLNTLFEFDTISESISNAVGLTAQDSLKIETIAKEKSGDDAHALILKTFINLAIYLSTSPYKVKKPYRAMEKTSAASRNPRLTKRKRKEAIKRLEEMRLLGVPYVVGTNVTISKELSEVSKNTVSGRKVDTASYVRGHIRNQVCGPQRSERKIIWIEPHWRGLEASKVSQKTYTVK